MSVVTIALLAMIVFAQAALATITFDTSTGLSTSMALPTVVPRGVTVGFPIRVFASSGSVTMPAEDGKVSIVTSYQMSVTGVITPVAASTATVGFVPGFNYANCTTITQLGCPSTPLQVTASLVIPGTVPPGTVGTLTASVTPGPTSGLIADASPAQGFVRVQNLAPNVAGITGSSPVPEGVTANYSVSATDPEGQALTYAWFVTSGNASISGPATNDTVAIRFEDGAIFPPSTVGIRVDVSDGTNVVTRTAVVGQTNVAPTATFVVPPPVDEGTAFTLALSSPVDVPADLPGLLYGFACTSGPLGGFTGTPSTSCPTNDNAVRSVAGVVRDKDGGGTQYNSFVTVKNVAPTATFKATPEVLPEGDKITLSLSGVFDPSSVDTAAGFLYAFDCGDGSGFTFGSIPTVICHPTSDNGDRTVTGLVRDKDGSSTTYTAKVSVENVAPTAVVSAPASVPEGDAFTIALHDPFDPSTDDTDAGFGYAFDCGDDPGYPSYGPDSSALCATNDDGVRTAQGSIRDKDLDATNYTASVKVENVAPSGSFNAPATVQEGGTFGLSMSGVTDPSSVDTAAGFEYAFDCGSGSLSAFGGASSVTCNASDDATLTVRGAVRDKDNGQLIIDTDVTVTNAPPSADFNAPSSVDEGSPISISLTGATDPSSDDVAAGFEYRFDCGSGFEPWGSSAATSCATADNGSRTVRGEIRDKDGAVRQYSEIVAVDNIDPQIANFDVALVQSSGCSTGQAQVTFTVSDAADDANDPIVGSIDWGDGSSTAISGRTISAVQGYSAGSYSLVVTISDGDGGIDTATATVNVTTAYTTTGIQQPINADGTSTFKLGSTIPVKARFLTCVGAPATNLQPEVRLTMVGSGTTAVNEVVSSSAADSGNLMRHTGDGQYMFNLSTKRSQFNAGADLAAGHYRLQIVGDGVPAIVVEFSLRK